MVHNFKHGGVKNEIMIYTIGDWNCDSIDSNHFFLDLRKSFMLASETLFLFI